MNLASVNLTPSSKAIESDSPAIVDNNLPAEDFVNALKGQQEQLLNQTSAEPKAQPEPPVPQLVQVENEVIVNAKPVSVSYQNELIALLEQYLPPASAEQEQDFDEVGTALLNLTGELIATPPEATASAGEVVVPAPQDSSGAVAMTGLTFVKPMPEEIKAKVNLLSETTAPIMPHPLKPNTATQTPQVSQTFTLSPKDSDSGEAFKLSLAAAQGSETAISEVKSEFMPIQKPIETRMESAVITRPMTHPGWSKDLGEHILWMNNKDISAAEIKLNPLHLGPISVRIDVNQDNQTTLFFTAHHPETKEALEASVPKLREMFQGQQLNLGNVNVSQNPHSNQGRTPSQPFYGTPGKHDGSFENAPNGLETGNPEQIVTKGLLSLYA